MTTQNANLNDLDTDHPNDDTANEALAMTQVEADAEAAQQPIAKGQKKRSFADTPLAQTRRENTQRLMKQNNVKGSALNQALGTSTTFVTQTVGPNPIMPISNDRARQIEVFFKVPSGYLDADHSVAQPAPPPRCRPTLNPISVNENVWEIATEAVLTAALVAELQPRMLTKVIALVVANANENKGVVNPAYVNLLVSTLL